MTDISTATLPSFEGLSPRFSAFISASLSACSYPFSGHHIGTWPPPIQPLSPSQGMYPTPRTFTTGSSGDAALVTIGLPSRVSSNTGPPTRNEPYRCLDSILTGIPRWSYCLHCHPPILSCRALIPSLRVFCMSDSNAILLLKAVCCLIITV